MKAREKGGGRRRRRRKQDNRSNKSSATRHEILQDEVEVEEEGISRAVMGVKSFIIAAQQLCADRNSGILFSLFSSLSSGILF